MLADHQVKVITFPPHTTHIFQSLYMSLFGDQTITGFIKTSPAYDEADPG
jgi:hypothetical protein